MPAKRREQSLSFLFTIFLSLIIIGFSILGGCKSPAASDDITVYITETGTKFHLSGCSYLSASKTAILHSEACAKGYSPCSVCKPPACK